MRVETENLRVVALQEKLPRWAHGLLDPLVYRTLEVSTGLIDPADAAENQKDTP